MNQKILIDTQIHYENIIDDHQFTVAGRKHISRTRNFDEETFFGFDLQEFTPRKLWQKVGLYTCKSYSKKYYSLVCKKNFLFLVPFKLCM